MKLSMLALAALAASASATPIRVIPVDALDSVSIKEAFDNAATPAAGETHRRPCHKASAGYMPGPIGALLHHLGLTRGDDADAHGPHAHGLSVEGWRHHLDEMEHRVVPLMEGGTVRILPFAPVENHVEGDKEMQGDRGEDERHMRWKALEGKQGVRKHHHHEGHDGVIVHNHKHHWHHKAHSFGGRLHRALYNLTPAESISLAFVLGAGIGSILHFIFMLCLLSFRLFRGGSCAERRAARRERKRLRKEAKHAQREGGIVLTGPEEVLPSYEDGETQRLVKEVNEKA